MNTSLQESEFSDKDYVQPIKHKIFQDFSSVQQKLKCFYHPEQFLTNFCRTQTCLLPLCPECVKIHSVSHKQKGTYGDFDTLESIILEKIKELNDSISAYKNDENNFVEYLKVMNYYEDYLRGKLLTAKSKVLFCIY